MADWITITPARMAIDKHVEEVDQLAKEKLAEQVQIRLRGMVDPGLDTRQGKRAQKIRSTAEGGRIVIREEDQGRVLRNVAQPVPDQGLSGLERLFEPSSGIPTIERDERGQERAVFRTVEAGELFGPSRQEAQDSAVRRSVSDAIGINLVDAYTEVLSDVERRHPESKY